MASLLPPVGTEVFRRFTPASLQEIKQRHEAEEKEQERRKKMEEVKNILIACKLIETENQYSGH